MADGYFFQWDNANKKWLISTNGGSSFSDLVENITTEKAIINGTSAPSGISAKGVLYYDSSANRVKLSENNGSFIDVNQAFTKAGSYVDLNGITVTSTIQVWRAPFACVIEGIYALRTGGTGANVNVQQGGADLRSSDLSLSTTSWTDFGTLQNTVVSAGNSLAFCIRSVSGSPTQIGFTVHIRRTGA